MPVSTISCSTVCPNGSSLKRRRRAISGHLSWATCSPAAKRPPRKDANAYASQDHVTLRARLRTPRGGALQRPGEREARGTAPPLKDAPEVGDRRAPLLPALALAHVDGAVLGGLLPHRHPQRAADQVGVGELLARAQVTIVEQNVGTRSVESLRRLLGLLLEPRQRDHVHIVRGDRPRPPDALLVVTLLDRRRHHPARPDPVASHDQRLLHAVFVDEHRAE